MERGRHGGEVDIPAASIRAYKKCLVAWRWGTTLPHVRLGVSAKTLLSLSWSLIALFPPPLLQEAFLAASAWLKQCGILGLPILGLHAM